MEMVHDRRQAVEMVRACQMAECGDCSCQVASCGDGGCQVAGCGDGSCMPDGKL